MKPTSIVALAVTFLTTPIFAAPVNEARSDTVRFQLSNDRSGANANVRIRTDGNWRDVHSLWADTDLPVDGNVLATTAMLTASFWDAECTLKGDQVEATLNVRNTWASLNDRKVVNLNGAQVACWDA